MGRLSSASGITDQHASPSVTCVTESPLVTTRCCHSFTPSLLGALQRAEPSWTKPPQLTAAGYRQWVTGRDRKQSPLPLPSPPLPSAPLTRGRETEVAGH